VGLDATLLDSGCCGMAGGFGFESDHYDVSVACGERKMLPAVREAAPDTLVIADGFSCREQIRQGTPRRALHLAQVLQMAAEQGPQGPRTQLPEQGYEHVVLPVPRRRKVVTAAVVAGGALAAAALIRTGNRSARRPA
jgi:hypothetical protein